MNPLGNDFEPVNKRRKNGPFYGSSDPITDSPSVTGPFWNLIEDINKDKDICIPLAINVAFGEILFKSKAEFMDSLSTSKYKQGKKTVNKKLNTNMRVRSNSSSLVKDGSGIDWEKVVILNSFAMNRKTDDQKNKLTGNKSEYIKVMIDCVADFFSKRDKLFAMHPEKSFKKQKWFII
jgi:hypothetical protein